jgi:hypothetical protein
MKLFASLSCAHKFGIPTQGFLFSILVVLCCVQNAGGVWTLTFICPKPGLGSRRHTEWTDGENAFRCNIFKVGTSFETSKCYEGYGYTHTEFWLPTKRGFNCRVCRGDQVWIIDPTNLCRCKPGYTGLPAWDAPCTQCPAGKYTSQHSMISCTDCPIGQTSSA